MSARACCHQLAAVKSKLDNDVQFVFDGSKEMTTSLANTPVYSTMQISKAMAPDAACTVPEIVDTSTRYKKSIGNRGD